MSKSAETAPKGQTEEIGRIENPDLEWLFTSKKGAREYKEGFLKKLMRRDWSKILITTLIYLLQAAPTWIMPIVTSDVIDLITYRPNGYITRLIIDAVILFVVIVQNVPTTMWRSNFTNRWIRSTTAEIKSGVMRKLQRLSITYHKEIEEGRIQSKLLRDIENVEGYYRCFMFNFIPSLVGALVSIGIAVWRSPIVTLFFLAIVPLNVLLSMAFRKRIRKDNYDYRRQIEQLSTKITTSIQMMTLTKAHGLVEMEEHAVDEKIGSVAQAGMRLDKTVARVGSMMWVVGQLLSALCLLFCVLLAVNDIITTGEVVLFQSLFSSISGTVLSLINSYPMLVTGKEAVRSLSELICAVDIERDNGRTHIQGVCGAGEFEKVCYH